MTEAEFKRKIQDQMKNQNMMSIRVEDKFTHGVPDTWMAGFNYVSIWEVKKDRIPRKGVQFETVLELYNHTKKAFYIMFEELKQGGIMIYVERPGTKNSLVMATDSIEQLCRFIVTSVHEGQWLKNE